MQQRIMYGIRCGCIKMIFLLHYLTLGEEAILVKIGKNTVINYLGVRAMRKSLWMMLQFQIGEIRMCCGSIGSI
jgi:hypothetical protein